jgi:hypothetical protein
MEIKFSLQSKHCDMNGIIYSIYMQMSTIDDSND